MSEKNKNVKRKQKMSKKSKIRMMVAFIFFGIIISTLTYKCFHYLKQIEEKTEEKKFLKEKLVLLEKEEEKLKIDIQKLDDPDYVARYAREKYLYSKDGEYIIRITE